MRLKARTVALQTHCRYGSGRIQVHEDEPMSQHALAEAVTTPNWVRDEVILALDLYLRRRTRLPGKQNPEVVELSALLRRLPVHSGRVMAANFRNPESVAFKIQNLASLDPSHPGAGFDRRGKVTEAVWNELGAQPDKVAALAAAIRAAANAPEDVASPEPDEDDVEAQEGKLLYRLHRRRERSGRLIDRVKDRARAAGEMHCRICGFDFGRTYGALGEGFIEAHHVVPLSAAAERRTRAEDLILVCSNCHSMLHRKRPWGMPDELRAIVDEHR
jgi:5-methylcytosine-specific restriction enzyme A